MTSSAEARIGHTLRSDRQGLVSRLPIRHLDTQFQIAEAASLTVFDLSALELNLESVWKAG